VRPGAVDTRDSHESVLTNGCDGARSACRAHAGAG
jgi:hypothetical protein